MRKLLRRHEILKEELNPQRGHLTPNILPRKDNSDSPMQEDHSLVQTKQLEYRTEIKRMELTALQVKLKQLLERVRIR